MLSGASGSHHTGTGQLHDGSQHRRVDRPEDGQIEYFVADDEHGGLISTRTVVQNVVVNSLDAAPFVDAELNSRMPELGEDAPYDKDRFREAWAILQRLSKDTVVRTYA